MGTQKGLSPLRRRNALIRNLSFWLPSLASLTTALSCPAYSLPGLYMMTMMTAYMMTIDDDCIYDDYI